MVLVELLLDVLRDVLLHSVLLERDAGDVECLFLHLLLHVGALELDLGRGRRRGRGTGGGRLLSSSDMAANLSWDTLGLWWKAGGLVELGEGTQLFLHFSSF